MKPNTPLFICGIAICLSAGAASAALTLTRVAAGDLDPSWDGVNLTTFDGTQAPNAGTTTDWHMFGGTNISGDLLDPSETKSGGSGIGALTFTQGATGGALSSESGSGSQPDVTWSDGTDVGAPPALVEEFIASRSDITGDFTGEVFSINLAAAAEETTAYLFLGALRAEGTLTATLGAESENDTYGTTAHRAIIYEIVYSSPTETSLALTWENTADNNLTNDGGIRFQAVTMNVVPEPSSAALLGLGGLALMLRRRKG